MFCISHAPPDTAQQIQRELKQRLGSYYFLLNQTEVLVLSVSPKDKEKHPEWGVLTYINMRRIH
ncbi:hypothetical protein [Pragia fontium]|uniref:hypothetical protein n=1 Tax=Pragia fontium TaxID=82985 RepID=UPI00130D5C93|nr:hypothetical protein [Pragia fontium]